MDCRESQDLRDQLDPRDQSELLVSRGKKEIQEYSNKGLMDPRDQQDRPDLPVLRGKREIEEHSYKDLLACKVQAIPSYFSGRVCQFIQC